MQGLSYLASKGHHVVLTQRKNVNVLHSDQLIVVLVEHCAIDQVPHILLITLGEVEHGLGISLWSLAETLALWILTNTFQDRPYRSREFLNTLLILFRG